MLVGEAVLLDMFEVRLVTDMDSVNEETLRSSESEETLENLSRKLTYKEDSSFGVFSSGFGVPSDSNNRFDFVAILSERRRCSVSFNSFASFSVFLRLAKISIRNS